jgi:hypothetical protein
VQKFERRAKQLEAENKQLLQQLEAAPGGKWSSGKPAVPVADKENVGRVGN